MTQHPPASSRHPGIAAATPTAKHARWDALQNAQGREGLVRTAPPGRWEIPSAGNSPFQDFRLRGFGRGLWLRLCHAVEAAQGPSPGATCFSKRTMMGNTPQSFLLPDLTTAAWHTSHMERAILDESVLELPQQLLCSAPGFSSKIHRDVSSRCWVSFSLLHKAGMQQPVDLRQNLHFIPHMFPVRSSWPSCRSDEILLIAFVCSEWRIQPILGHAMD